MNQRIKELAIETDAWCDMNVIGDPKYNIIWEEKFAELIVRECIDQCAYTPNSNDEWDKGVKWAANQIAEHFGVEE